MNQMVYAVATRRWKDWRQCVRSWYDTASQVYEVFISTDMEVVPALQHCYERTTEPILAFIHDDVIIHEKDWDLRVLKEFEDESVGLVSFTGALGHGRPDLYRVPYHLPDLARQGFMSNMRDAENHGMRFTGERDVAIADGCTCFVRRSILDRWDHRISPIDETTPRGGFPKDVPVGYFMWMENLCCEVRRQGFRIRMVGVDFTHIGGRTSVMHSGEDRAKQYEAEHAYFYEHNRDVMPYRVKE